MEEPGVPGRRVSTFWRIVGLTLVVLLATVVLAVAVAYAAGAVDVSGIYRVVAAVRCAAATVADRPCDRASLRVGRRQTSFQHALRIEAHRPAYDVGGNSAHSNCRHGYGLFASPKGDEDRSHGRLALRVKLSDCTGGCAFLSSTR